uniref:Putative secreted protein n=1 Tax=Anopheles darlingi TaxID=43151 RepID=A0A2M4DRC8_ANODA
MVSVCAVVLCAIGGSNVWKSLAIVARCILRSLLQFHEHQTVPVCVCVCARMFGGKPGRPGTTETPLRIIGSFFRPTYANTGGPEVGCGPRVQRHLPPPPPTHLPVWQEAPEDMWENIAHG